MKESPKRLTTKPESKKLDQLLLAASQHIEGKVIDTEGLKYKIPDLLEMGANPSAYDKNGMTALMYASYYNHIQVVEYLEPTFTPESINMKDNHGNNALIHCCMRGNAALARYLLNTGSDINESNDKGKTALIISSHLNHIKLSEILVFHGADHDARDQDDMKAIDYARKQGYKQTSDLLEWASRMPSQEFKISQTSSSDSIDLSSKLSQSEGKFNRYHLRYLIGSNSPTEKPFIIDLNILDDDRCSISENELAYELHNREISHLKITGTDGDFRIAEIASKILMHNSSLKYLDLSGNGISHLGAEEISTTLGMATKLESLNLTNNNLRNAGLSSLQRFYTGDNLKTLNLDNNNIRENSVKESEKIVDPTIQVSPFSPNALREELRLPPIYKHKRSKPTRSPDTKNAANVGEDMKVESNCGVYH